MRKKPLATRTKVTTMTLRPHGLRTAIEAKVRQIVASDKQLDGNTHRTGHETIGNHQQSEFEDALIELLLSIHKTHLCKQILCSLVVRLQSLLDV